MEGERIDLVYTATKGCWLEKPRILLGACLWRWLHWRDGRSTPCLRDYGLPCKPCGEQREYAYLAAALIEPRKPDAANYDPRPGNWQALTETEREAHRAEMRKARPHIAHLADQIDSACICKLWPHDPAEVIETHFAARRIVQCVPGVAMHEMDLENLRGAVVQISVSRGLVRLTRLPVDVDPLDDFDPQLIFDRRYGLHRMARPEPVEDDKPATLPFRKQA